MSKYQPNFAWLCDPNGLLVYLMIMVFYPQEYDRTGGEGRITFDACPLREIFLAVQSVYGDRHALLDHPEKDFFEGSRVSSSLLLFQALEDFLSTTKPAQTPSSHLKETFFQFKVVT